MSVSRTGAAVAALALLAGCADAAPEIGKLVLPPGFAVEIYAREVPNARSLELSPAGTLFIGTRTEGKVYAVVDRDRDYRADVVHVIAAGLDMPNGVAFRDGSLYVAEVGRILRYDDIEARLEDPPAPVVVYDELPTERHHGWKFIAFGPDGKLYVPVGAPCNICDPPPPYATILRMNADGTGVEVYARGVRNSVGFTWHPHTGELWFTDNGPDWLGDDRPPCELNHAPGPGLHFGYPYVHGRDIVDPELGAGHDPREYEAPALELGPHVAPLGLEFYTGAMFPPAWRGDLLVAEHGSWNRSRKIGYRVMRVPFAGGRPAGYQPFIDGWLQGERVWGRPVDLEPMPDGSLLLSDDVLGVVYRIVYRGEIDSGTP